MGIPSSPSAVAARRAFFDSLAPRRERDVRRHRLYYDDRVRWLMSLIPGDASIVEVGCGVGAVLRRLPQSKKTGIDFSPEMIRLARERDPTSVYVLDDAERLTQGGPHDYVLLLDAINFLGDVQAALSEIREKLCHDRTRLVITHYNFLWSPLFLLAQRIGWKTRFPEQNWLGRADITNLLTLTGFEVVQTGERMLLPLGVPLLSALCNRYLVTLPLFRRLALVKTIVARPLPRERRERTVTVLSAMRNEKGNVRQIVDAMPAMGTKTEVLFVEGHSTDGTWEEIERVAREYKGPLAIRGLKQPGTGKADALHAGIAASTGEILFVYDGDYTVHPSELPKIYDALASGRAEFVNASRLVYPMQEGAMRILNLIGNKLFSALFSWLFSQKLVDTLSPVKGFFRRDEARMDSRRDPFGDFDFFLGAAAQQLKMREVPVHYLERTYGTTKIRRFRHGWLLLKLCLYGARRIRWI